MKVALIDLLPIVMMGLFFYRAVIIKPLSEINQEYLSMNAGKCLRGLLAICVIIHHLAQRTTGGLIFPLFSYVGYLAVAVFFFLSGYGLQKSYMQSDDYKKYFLFKRLPAVLIPYITVTIMFWIMHAAIGMVYTVKQVITAIIDGSPIVSFSWYIITIIVFYVAYWFLMILFKSKSVCMLIGACIWYVLYALFCIKMGYGAWWYNASHVLIVGMFWAMYEEKLIKLIKKRYVIISIITILAFFITFLGRFKASDLLPIKYSGLILTMASAVSFVLCILLFMMKCRVGNKMMIKLGEISLAVYLVQGLFIVGLRNSMIHIESDLAYSLLTVFGSIIFGWVLSIGLNIVLTKYKKWLNKRLIAS